MQYVTLTRLGTILGTSRTTVHAWLAGIGLLTLARQPSEKAIQEGFCKGIANNAVFLWHRHRTVAALRATYRNDLPSARQARPGLAAVPIVAEDVRDNIPTKVTIKHADVLAVLKGLEENIFDDAFFDPPYGLGFKGKQWDGALPPVEVWRELLRVCKPGAMALSFGYPRTHHRLMCALEDAGWIIRDTMMWLFVSGMPKSQDISKAIDRILGAERSRQNGCREADGPMPVVTSEAARWLGYGTALKPAWEAIIVAQKPHEGSYAENALKWGVAGLNINGSRIPCDDKGAFPVGKNGADRGMYGSPDRTPDSSPNARFPANIILDQAAADLLDEQGAISRFFYCAKAGKEERNAGLDGLRNRHPTVKPLDLCRYLATLILPPERDTPRKLIVPYAGSGSEIIGAVQADWDEVLGIEFDSRYVRIAERRIRHWILSMPTTGDE